MKRLLALGLALALLGAGCGKDLPTAGSGEGSYDRVVLTELFTSLNCANCPEAEHALDRLYEEEVGHIAVIHWHPTRNLPDVFGIEMTDDRYETYQDKLSGIVGLPTCVFDGIAPIVGGNAGTYEDYRGYFENEALLAAEFGATLTPVLNGNRIDVDIDVEASSALAAGTLDLTTVLVEHKVPKPAGQPGPDTLSFVARTACVQEVDLTPGATDQFVATLSVDGSWNADQLYVVAIFQETDLGEVLQSAMAQVTDGGTSGFHDFEFSAPDTNLVAQVGPDANLAHLYFENTGTLGDTLRIDLPNDYRELPDDWSAFLCTEEGTCYTTPFDLYLEAGEAEEHLVIDLFSLSEGQGWVGITVASRGDPSLSDSLRIHFTTAEPQDFGFSATASETEFTAAIEEQVFAHILFENTGALADTLTVDIVDESTTIPGDWALSICDDQGICIGPHLDLPIEAGETIDSWGIDVIPFSAGGGDVVVEVASKGDPALITTLTFEFTVAGGGNYGFTATAPVTEFTPELEETVFAQIIFENTGEENDVLAVDIVDELTTVPGDWALSICDDRGVCIGPHLDLPINAGDTIDSWGVDVIPYSEGSGQVGISVASTGDPGQTTTLVFDFETAGAQPEFTRTVLGEMFTTWWCTNCPIAEEALDTLYDEEGPAQLAVIHWHPFADDSGGLGIPETDPRLAAYTSRFGGQASYPTTIFSGNERITSGTEETYGEYRASYETQASAACEVNVELEAFLNGGETIDATIDIESLATMETADLELTVVVVEHEAPLPLIPVRIFSYTARRAVTESLEVGGGAALQRTAQFTVEEDWNLQHLHVVAFLQEPGYGEILQAAMIALPHGVPLAAGLDRSGH